MMRKFTILIFILTFFTLNSNQIKAQAPKQEMRAVWLATVYGLDWPDTKIPATGGESDINKQKEQLRKLLDSMEVIGINAIFLQVRSEADALYQSSYEPWSAHLVANRGDDPGYDPLEYAIDECHARGMELHAWLNPYRFESVAGKYAGQEGDYSQTNPEWVLSYGSNGSILDPGNPEVRQRITDIVEEIVTNYDVDGIVFDDYFYGYGGTPASLDAWSQNNWKPDGMDVHDWRRSNINQMIADVYHTIKSSKNWVRFGVSPFGIWTTDVVAADSYGIRLPQGITGLDAYNVIYADAVAWLKEGTVDYVSPQIYWQTTSVNQDYKKLAPWWSDVANRFGRHLYVSHTLADLDASDYPPPVALKSAYMNFLRTELKGMSMMEYFSQLGSVKSVAGFDPAEIGQQIYWNRISDKNQAPGSVFFRASMMMTPGFKNYLLSNKYENKALPPALTWISKKTRSLPYDLQLDDTKLSWKSDESNVRFAIYAIPELLLQQPGNFNDGTFLLGMSYAETYDMTEHADLIDDHVFAVSVVDRLGNEYPPVVMGMGSNENQPAQLLLPADKADLFKGFTFTWMPVEGAVHYQIEIASDPQFEDLADSRIVTEPTLASGDLNLKDDSMYYWRVITRMANADDVSSTVRSFSVKPLPRPLVIYPVHGQEDVGVVPVIRWEEFDEGFNFRLQIAKNSSFTGLVLDEENVKGTLFKSPPGVLETYATYFLRVQAVSEDSVTVWSNYVEFSTVHTPPSVPVIISPANGETVAGPEITITVEEDVYASSFAFQRSRSESFPWHDRAQFSVNAPGRSITFDDLSEGTWYVKVKAGYRQGLYTEWSDPIMFNLLTTSNAVPVENEFSLEQPIFSTPETLQISYSLAQPSRVQLYITSITGKRMAILSQQYNDQGKHTLNFYTGDLLPGIYLLTLETGYGRKTVKLIKSK